MLIMHIIVLSQQLGMHSFVKAIVLSSSDLIYSVKNLPYKGALCAQNL